MLIFPPKLKLVLSVHVGDFKLAGKEENLEKGWKMMEEAGLELDPPTPFGDYLGCGQFKHDVPLQDIERRLENILPVIDPKAPKGPDRTKRAEPEDCDFRTGI